MLQEQLLLQLSAPVDGVALAALDYWQDEYLASLQQLPADSRPAVLQHQQQVLQALTRAVIGRSQLPIDVAAAATADARDLPEEIRTVRGAQYTYVFERDYR